MKPHQQPRRIKASERCYHWLIWFYPAPFRTAFGQSMRQVFRDQCLDVIERKGGWGLAVLWLRTLLDFAWTCPKEYFVALPTLPGRIWEQILRKPVWLYPVSLTITGILITLIAAFQLPQYHSSTGIVLVRVIVGVHPSPVPLSVSGVTELEPVNHEKLDSKAVLYPVIEKLDLPSLYQKKLGLMSPPTEAETLEVLLRRVNLGQRPRSAVIRITVYDEDKHLAKIIADAVVEQYQKHLIASKASGPTALAGQISPSISLLKAPEESVQLVRPQLRGSLLSGGTVSLAGGAMVLLMVLVQRWRNGRRIWFSKMAVNRCQPAILED